MVTVAINLHNSKLQLLVLGVFVLGTNANKSSKTSDQIGQQSNVVNTMRWPLHIPMVLGEKKFISLVSRGDAFYFLTSRTFKHNEV